MPAILEQRAPAVAKDAPTKPLCHICTPVGMLGYGFDEALMFEHLEQMSSTGVPTAIILDSGSTDSGPTKLALGTKTCPDSSYRADLTKLMRAVLEFRIPLLVSSVGGSGSDEHVDDFLDMIREIAVELNSPRDLRVLTIYSEISKDIIRDKLESGQITGCGNAVPTLTAEILDHTPRVLAQMGTGPFLDAMSAHPDFDVVLTGRAYDPAPYVAFCLREKSRADGAQPIIREENVSSELLGGFYHMGKIMECGGVCCVPEARGARATVYQDGTFDISSLDPASKCTCLSVAAHTLYEKSRPDILHGPGGFLDLRQTTYETVPEDPDTVRVRGAQFECATATSAEPWTVKLEGARTTGYRTLFMGSFHDPILVEQIDDYLAAGKKRVAKEHSESEGHHKLDFHMYGRSSQEVFIVAEVLAETQQLATRVASSARVYCVHASYKDQLATSGNFAFGLGGVMEVEVGPCCEFSVYHLMPLRPGERAGRLVSEVSGRPVARTQADGGLFAWQASTLPRSSSPEVDSMYTRQETQSENTRKKAIVSSTKQANGANGVSNK